MFLVNILIFNHVFILGLFSKSLMFSLVSFLPLVSWFTTLSEVPSRPPEKTTTSHVLMIDPSLSSTLSVKDIYLVDTTYSSRKCVQ